MYVLNGDNLLLDQPFKIRFMACTYALLNGVGRGLSMFLVNTSSETPSGPKIDLRSNLNFKMHKISLK